jgi:hypothetical protein
VEAFLVKMGTAVVSALVELLVVYMVRALVERLAPA